jgi:hypothetical protein
MRRYSPKLVAGFKWKPWPGSNGIDGRNEMESVAGIKWNGWPEWSGITGRDHLEYSNAYSIDSGHPFQSKAATDST